jgi:hypothetical protein
MEDVIVGPCLLCDAPTQVSREDWQGEAPFILCNDCNEVVVKGTVSWPMLKMIYVLRCQVADLVKKIDTLETGMRQLLTGKAA